MTFHDTMRVGVEVLTTTEGVQYMHPAPYRWLVRDGADWVPVPDESVEELERGYALHGAKNV
jgi:hypothetical protein